MGNSHHEYSPSSFPQFEKCIHFKSAEVGEPAIRGTMQHSLLEAIGKHFKETESFEIESKDVPLLVEEKFYIDLTGDEIDNVVFGVNSATTILREYGMSWSDSEVDIEQELVAMGDNGTMIYGTGDIVAETDDLFLALDYKSGQPRDYSGQLKTYAFAGMQETGKKSAVIVPIYGTKKYYEKAVICYEDASRYFNDMAKKIVDMKLPPVANQYCSWCDKRLSCKARNKTVLALRDREQKDKLKGITISSNLTTLSDTRLANLCSYAKILKDFVSDAEKELKSRLNKGAVIDGWVLKETKGKRSVKNLPLLFANVDLDLDVFLENCSMTVGKFNKLKVIGEDRFIKIGNGSVSLKQIIKKDGE